MRATAQSSGDPYFRCHLCGGGEHQLPTGPSIPCPVCSRPVADVSSVLLRMPLPKRIVELLPESVARENRGIMFDVDGLEVIIATDLRKWLPAATGLDWMDKLRFILNREIRAVHASKGAIDFAIERDYGPSDPDQ